MISGFLALVGLEIGFRAWGFDFRIRLWRRRGRRLGRARKFRRRRGLGIESELKLQIEP